MYTPKQPEDPTPGAARGWPGRRTAKRPQPAKDDRPTEPKPGRGLSAAVLLDAIRRIVKKKPAWGVRKV